MKLSAALLVKCSTVQLNKFYRDAVKAKLPSEKLLLPSNNLPTLNQKIGNEAARSKAVSPYIEMQGEFKHKDISILFTIDEVIEKKTCYHLIEHKWLKDENSYEEWFLINSVIQTAFLGSLAHYSRDLKTANFVDSEKHSLTLNKRIISKLQFGNTTYNIKPNPLGVMRFYLTKARAIIDYNKSKRFDTVFKHNEMSYLKNHISYLKARTNVK